VAAVASIPDDPRPIGALFWPALWLSLGLLSVPIFRASADTSVLLRTEHFLMLGLFYWLLLDPIQGAYPLDGVSYDDVALGLIAIGIMALGIWIGSVGRGWSLPGLVLRAAKQPLNTKSLFAAAVLTFCLRAAKQLGASRDSCCRNDVWGDDDISRPRGRSANHRSRGGSCAHNLDVVPSPK
jgi:hypothetical protein